MRPFIQLIGKWEEGIDERHRKNQKFAKSATQTAESDLPVEKGEKRESGLHTWFST